MSLSETNIELMFGTVRRRTDNPWEVIGVERKQSAARIVRPIAGVGLSKPADSGLAAQNKYVPGFIPTQQATSTYAVFEMTVVFIELPPLESLVAMVCP